MITIDVLGTPAAKGSPHARVHNGHVVMHEGKKTKSWERVVREAAVERIAGPLSAEHEGVVLSGPAFVEQPLFVGIVFRLARPAGHWGKRGLKPSAAVVPHRKPDADKLARSTLDALTGIVFDDDSRIVELIVRKVYAAPGEEGARIIVKRWQP